MFKKLVFTLAVLGLLAPGAMAAEKLNINSATMEELAANPAVGPDFAEKIIQYREGVGDLTSADDLNDIEGMNPERIKNIQDNFVIEGVTEVDCNC